MYNIIVTQGSRSSLNFSEISMVLSDEDERVGHQYLSDEHGHTIGIITYSVRDRDLACRACLALGYAVQWQNELDSLPMSHF